MAHFELRDLSASLIGMIARKYSKSSPTLKPRLARTCLKSFLDPNKTFGVHYGAVKGLGAIGGPEVIRVLIVPNLIVYESLIKNGLEEEGMKKDEADMVLVAILSALKSLEADVIMSNGHGGAGGEEMKEKLVEVLGDFFGTKVYELENSALNNGIIGATDTRMVNGLA
jgi:transcription initiation factor TFIID subunit 6